MWALGCLDGYFDMVQIQKIDVKDTYDLRHKLLRPHQSIDLCQYPGDLDSHTAHFGAYRSGEIVGILSIYKVQNNAIDIAESWQLRAMATTADIRGKGYGSKLIHEAEQYASHQGARCIWANSRLNAVGFYENHGYSSIGSEFIIQDIGPHYLVHKKVT